MRGTRCYTSFPAATAGGDGIGEILLGAWRRLARKQFLVLYPFTLSVFNTLAFLAVYASLEPSLGLNHFFRSNFTRWTYLHDHMAQLLTPGLPLAVALAAGAGVCLLSAAIRAPFFRAITGLHYPLAPRSAGELLRLAVFYLGINLLFIVLPSALDPEGTTFAIVAWALIPVQALVMFGDYVIVFEGLNPWRAVTRSFWLLRVAWRAAVAIILFTLVLSYLVYLLYSRYYMGDTPIFLLLPFSQILVDAFLITVIDVLLVSTYEQHRG